ncbi:MAG: hypothetical protein K6F03_02815 [Saccharofermentans sp.]|nr:hypothetical protein [Saccharofermentans sp.]
MGEKKYTLEEYVFRDIRSDEKVQKKIKERENKGEIVDSIKMIDIYRGMKNGPDAERWKYALDSYKQYPFFYNKNNKSYDRSTGESYMFYQCSGKGKCWFKITADTLTGPYEILKPNKGTDLSKEDNTDLKDALELFCSVVYTVGNFCPVMKNPGGSKGSDTCWYKLSNNLICDELGDIEEVFCRRLERKGVNNDLSNRHAENMFNMFHDNPNRKTVIKRLMLMDYYSDPGYKKLIIDKTPNEIWNEGKGVNKYINLVNLITLTIIKRGIRIYKQNDLRGINIDKLAVKLINEKIRREGWKMEFECK